MIKLGNRIAARRKELGMTQQELADKLFISVKTVSKWET
ncbi:MAG: helix-turn-helix domain-containing protein, partial [Bacilli bacterium]